MKYGAALRAHSIPAWAHHNIDYDEIKKFIKDHTTPGNGSAWSIPGTGDVRGKELEESLYDILAQQHKRINLFVWSKAGEIRRRLDHLAQQTAELHAKGQSSHSRISTRRMERYGKLESDVLKAGEELRSLSRFITAQQTALRKLIKKHKKWTGSDNLEFNIHQDVLNDPSSFTKTNLDPLLVEWEKTLNAIRDIYAAQIARSSQNDASSSHAAGLQATLSEMQKTLQSQSQAEFDAFFATLPLGEAGKNAVYWVHPENVVQLQVFLLQHARSHPVRRQSAVSTPTDSLPRRTSYSSTQSRRNSDTVEQDTGLLIVDNQTNFAREQSSTTLEARENSVGVVLQNAAVTARWTKEDQAIVTARMGQGSETINKIPVRRKHLATVLDPVSSTPARKASISIGQKDSTSQVEELRSWLAKNDHVRPLAMIVSTRQRFANVAADSSGFMMATLDKAIAMKRADLSSIDVGLTHDEGSTFPFAVLRVRQEGSYNNQLIRELDSSHLVERVRGFSLEYHALWHCCQPENIVQPFWIPLLQKDIRKLPKLPSKRETGVMNSGFGSQSETPVISTSNASESGNGDTTAVEEQWTTTSTKAAAQLQTPPLSSFRKKRRRSYAREISTAQAQAQKYWSEYDHPSDSDEAGAYVIYIDPHAESSLSQTWRNLRKMFKNKAGTGEEPLLRRQRLLEAGGAEDMTSSSEDDRASLPQQFTTRRSYRTMENGPVTVQHAAENQVKSSWLPAVTTACLGASLAILAVGYLLAMTGRKKQAKEVDAGVIFAVASSLLFAVLGVASMFGRGGAMARVAKAVTLVVLAFDAIASGALLAWILA